MRRLLKVLKHHVLRPAAFSALTFLTACGGGAPTAETDDPVNPTLPVSRSDHASFWWQDYPAFLLTDTSEGRDPHYHKPTDTIDHLNFDEMARLAEGFIDFLQTLARAESSLSY